MKMIFLILLISVDLTYCVLVLVTLLEANILSGGTTQ